MSTNWDAIVIGSGFGGAVSACRLAEKGLAKILVLERGRRWEPDHYPRRQSNAWLWDQNAPELLNGWIDLRIFDDMIVAQGAGVGGGSLIYANVSVEAKPEAFRSGWPEEITYQELEPYYERAGKMLKVRTIPETQLTRRYELMRDAAHAIGEGARFRSPSLSTTTGATTTATASAIRAARSGRTSTAPSRARACTAASATSAARYAPRTRSTSITSRARSESSGSRSASCTWPSASRRMGGAIRSTSSASTGSGAAS